MARRTVISLVFLLSGFAALIYQVAWQRALFRIFGIDSASVAIVVTAFMLGLGAGSFLGGELSKRGRALPLFALFELGIGLFGCFSLDLFEYVGGMTLGLPRAATATVTLSLVLIPTTLMGATLPLLVAHETEATGNVGRSLGLLYFVNTLGASLACFASSWIILGAVGLRRATQAAALLNVVIGALVAFSGRKPRKP